jgi:hypothetical protein
MVDIFSGPYRVLRIDLTENEANEWMEHEGENVRRFHLHRTSRKRKKSYQCGITRLALLNGRTGFVAFGEQDWWVSYLT